MDESAQYWKDQGLPADVRWYLEICVEIVRLVRSSAESGSTESGSVRLR